MGRGVVAISSWSEVALAQPSSCGCELEFIVMRISILRAAGVFTAGALFLAAALAQQTPASPTKSSTNPKSSASTKTSTTAEPDAAPAAMKGEPLTLTTGKQKQSYAIGMNL